ncbi:MAG: PKD domain-containing protein [Rhodocyclaceae bacterium]|nr:PKD domain-containing protein [Rhodocyclaceae bacterium]MBX3667998.1 PKD domain-containing protein [Rhodocyclaceae bacterium]
MGTHTTQSAAPRARKFASLLLAGATLAFGLVSGAGADDSVAHRQKPPFPQVKLDRHVRGDEAVTALGNKLAAVADWYGMTPQTFSAMLRADRHARLDTAGRLHYVDELIAPLGGANAVSGSLNSTGALLPLDQTFLLHSRPGAKRVMYLDFRGGTLSGTAWNASYGITTINAPAFDLDGDATTFNDTELGRMQYIWQRVAEDYAPLDVDVTTELPAAAAITRSSTSDDTFGTRVLITKDFTAATSSPCGCGGIAYVGIFDDVGDYYKPALVFYDKLGSGNEKYVAEAISHEAGHNSGLSHDGYNDGVTVQGYYAGHGSGATGWAPIMGVGYSKELTQWSKGEYPYATQTQDDFAVMQATGLPLRADDHGDTPATATPFDYVANGGAGSISGSGAISTRTDVDYFSFYAGAGAATINVSPVARGANLDIEATLYDAYGNVLAVINPSATLNASISVTLPAAGTYYVKVDGVGKGDLTTGYSDYASVGNYFISGSVPNSGNLPPTAAASASVVSGTTPLVVDFSSAGSSDPEGGALTYDWNFGDGSAHSSAANPSHTYASAGTFVATLVVTDALGATASAQVTITATAPPPALHVKSMTITLAKNNKKGAQATAKVTVVDANGVAVSSATVTGTWSGVVSGSSSVLTNSSGVSSSASAWTKTRGTLTYTVTSISRSGYLYDSAQNAATSVSITY